MLQRDGGTYYFRKAIPSALRPFFPSKKDGSKGQRELLVSLRTKDKEVAKSRLHRAALEADAKQLRTLFASPLYTGAESKARRTKPGSYVEPDALWWLFPMTLYSGMRIEEAMGLRVEDMREVDGVLAFVVESRPDRTLKTLSSARTVPVHTALIRLGLVEWRDKQPRGGLLFPELRPDKRHGKLTAALSKTAGRYLRALKMPASVTTHSTRHAFADGLRRAKVEPEIRSPLLGHSTQTMTELYGAGHDVQALEEAVNAVRYEGVGQ